MVSTVAACSRHSGSDCVIVLSLASLCLQCWGCVEGCTPALQCWLRELLSEGRMEFCLLSFVRQEFHGSGEMAGVRAFAAVAEDPGSVPIAHVVAQSHPQLQFQGSQHPLLTRD